MCVITCINTGERCLVVDISNSRYLSHGGRGASSKISHGQQSNEIYQTTEKVDAVESTCRNTSVKTTNTHRHFDHPQHAPWQNNSSRNLLETTTAFSTIIKEEFGDRSLSLIWQFQRKAGTMFYRKFWLNHGRLNWTKKGFTNSQKYLPETCKLNLPSNMNRELRILLSPRRTNCQSFEIFQPPTKGGRRPLFAERNDSCLQNGQL